MSAHSPLNLAAIRTFAVVSLAGVVLGYSLPDLRRLWVPVGTLGYLSNSDNIINAVDANSPASKAGLKVGDRIEVASTDPEQRGLIVGGLTNTAGQQVTFPVDRGSQQHVVTLVSEPDSMDVATKSIIIGRELALLLFVGLGALLVLRHPSIATWGFYFYCLGLNGAPLVVALTSLHLPWTYIVWVSWQLMQQVGFVGVAVFALVFLHDQSVGWRRTVSRFAPVALLAMCVLSAYTSLAYGWFGRSAQRAANLLLFLEACVTVVAVYAFVDTYLRAQGSDRQRIRWVVAGFGIALVAYVADLVVYSGPFGNPPYWVHGSLLLASALVPLTVAYAVIKHRVIDVSFVVSRALVYGVLTTLLVGIFSLIDWFFTDYLRLARLGTVAEVGAVVAFGLWFNGLHKRVDSLIDATFFRQRHRAEVQLARVAVALPLATTINNVAHFLVDEPVRAMSLASAALFRRGRDGVFTREASEGWDAYSLSKLDDQTDGPLLLLAQAENGPLSLYDHPWRTEGTASGPARPVLALPIMVRRELAAIVFYGSHVHGEALDPDETKAIAGLATGAAAAYDHLEAEAMRLEVKAQKDRIEALERVIAEGQIQPA